MESNRHGGMESNRHGGQIIGLLRYMPSNSGTSHHSQYPTLDSSDLSFVRRQRRMKESSEGAIPVGSLEPCRCRIRCLLIPVSAFFGKPSCPQRWVDLSDYRLALWNRPAIERPEMDRPFALLPQVEEPRQTGVRRGCDLSLNTEPED